MQDHIVQKPGAIYSATISNTSSGISGVATDVVAGILVVETGAVRMKWDGELPEAGVGLLMAKDSVWEIVGRDFFTAMQFCAESDDALITIAYETGG